MGGNPPIGRPEQCLDFCPCTNQHGPKKGYPQSKKTKKTHPITDLAIAYCWNIPILHVGVVVVVRHVDGRYCMQF